MEPSQPICWLGDRFNNLRQQALINLPYLMKLREDAEVARERLTKLWKKGD